jgi:hypothetical protein
LFQLIFIFLFYRSVPYFLENTYPWEGGISSDVIWEKKYGKGAGEKGKCEGIRRKDKRLREIEFKRVH